MAPEPDGAWRPDGALGGTGADLTDEVAAGRSFEDLMTELEAVTDRLATGEIGIEAAADLYERAERLHLLAAGRLAQVQARVESLRPPHPDPS